jgi:hypothetical protein
MERFEKAWEGEERMTKQQQRFQAAVAAMQGLLAHPKFEKLSFLILLGDAVKMADALLAELDRTASKDEPQPDAK